MKNRVYLFVVPLLAFVFSGLLVHRNATGASGSYSPATVYAGDYAPSTVFYSSSNGQFWRRIPNLYRLDRIVCQDAVDHLRREGMWKGHLKSDGSCGASDEPDIWAVGNWLNYQDASATSGR